MRQVLWVQEALPRRDLTIASVPGCENLAGLGTKHLAEKDIHECMRRAGCKIAGGLSRLAFEGRKGVRLEPATLRATEPTRGREHRLRLTG